MIYDCFVRQKKCRSILKHVLKRCDNRKSCRRPVVSLSHATKSYRVNRPLEVFFLENAPKQIAGTSTTKNSMSFPSSSVI